MPQFKQVFPGFYQHPDSGIVKNWFHELQEDSPVTIHWAESPLATGIH